MSRTSFHARLCLAAVAAAVLLGSPAAHAAKLRQQNLTRLITDAEQIVAGKVTRVTDGVTDRGLPYTEITIAVADSARGELRGGKPYTFRQFGLLEPRKMPNGRVPRPAPGCRPRPGSRRASSPCSTAASPTSSTTAACSKA